MWENPYFQCRQPLIPVIVLIKNASFSITTNEEKHPPPQLHQLINALQKSDAKFVKLFGLFKFSRNIDTFVLLSPFFRAFTRNCVNQQRKLTGCIFIQFSPELFCDAPLSSSGQILEFADEYKFFPPLAVFCICLCLLVLS